jgi:peptide/nickel transport system substrate-binding protein
LLPPPVTWIPTTDPRWKQARASVVDELAYNPQRALQLLGETGWRRGADGKLNDPNGQPLTFELRDSGTPATERVVARYWSEIGAQLDLTQGPLELPSRPAAPSSPRAVVQVAAVRLDTTEIARLLYGPSRGDFGGTGPFPRDMEFVVDHFLTALRSEERLALERQLVVRATEDVFMLPLGFRLQAVPVARGVTGLLPRSGLELQPWMAFNAHEWSHQ